MENLGSEVSQKMRCAVKAKLIELGTGGTSGYIDDELPDYVMIMVANKRSKQQMISDLNLFLGQHTEVFVIWLHEVLQKLQEVTLPAIAITKGKRKSGENEENSSTNKKEKKEKKKDKKIKKVQDKKNINDPKTQSITDVFVDHLLEKTKSSLPIDPIKAKKEISSTQNSNITLTPLNNNSTDHFDIPTISEIVQSNSTIEQSSRDRDVAELADIQKKIYQAKKHLKYFDENDESEDEDFLNIKEDAEEFEDDVNKAGPVKRGQMKSPIIFDNSSDTLTADSKNERSEYKKKIIYQPSQKSDEIIRQNNVQNQKQIEREKSVEKSVKKKSVHERLGLKIQSRSIIRSSEQRQIEGNNLLKRKEFETSHLNNKIKDRKIDANKESKIIEKRKLGSKIIVAQTKTNIIHHFSDEDDDDFEEENVKSLNSVVKIKPRPTISPSRQACKNLLLRAVAEAQKSTTIQPSHRKENLNQNVANKTKSRQLYSKSFRNSNRNNISQRVTKDNIVIEVNSDNYYTVDYDEDEYIPEPISERGDSESEQIYVPKAIMTEINEIEVDKSFDKEIDENTNKKTQFVVTLDEKTGEKYSSKGKIINKVKEKKKNLVSKTKLTKENVQLIQMKQNYNSADPVDITDNTDDKKNYIRIYKRPKDIKKMVIRNDTDDDEFDPIANNKNAFKNGKNIADQDKKNLNTESVVKESSVQDVEIVPKTKKRISVSPIKFDLNEIEKDSSTIFEDDNENDLKEMNKKLIRKSECVKKYDKIPDLLSAVSISRQSIKLKIKERCKFYPSCTNGDCEFFHPSGPCKSFPNCKFADNCLYIHPKCKFDQSCNRNGCNFSHSAAATISQIAPPLSSHVVPVQNYKTITANPLPTMCKFYPNCSNTQCTFYHPKICRFGKNCMNKIECNFYHHDLPSNNKFKWIATTA